MYQAIFFPDIDSWVNVKELQSDSPIYQIQSPQSDSPIYQIQSPQSDSPIYQIQSPTFYRKTFGVSVARFSWFGYAHN